MRVINVIDTIKVGDNTAVTIDSNGEGFKNGVGIIDEKGTPHIVLSIGTVRVNPEYIEQKINRITLLVEGEFESGKIFV